MIALAMFGFVAALTSPEGAEPNPLYIHQQCVNSTALKLMKSGEPADLVVHAAMTKCTDDFDRAVRWFNEKFVNASDRSGTAVWFRESTRKTLEKSARDAALLKVLEAKAK